MFFLDLVTETVCSIVQSYCYAHAICTSYHFAYHLSIVIHHATNPSFCLFMDGDFSPQYREVAAAIVQHPHWKEMMRMSQTEETKKDTKIVTPMRMLIESMPGTNKQ